MNHGVSFICLWVICWQIQKDLSSSLFVWFTSRKWIFYMCCIISTSNKIFPVSRYWKVSKLWKLKHFTLHAVLYYVSVYWINILFECLKNMVWPISQSRTNSRRTYYFLMPSPKNINWSKYIKHWNKKLMIFSQQREYKRNKMSKNYKKSKLHNLVKVTKVYHIWNFYSHR